MNFGFGDIAGKVRQNITTSSELIAKIGEAVVNTQEDNSDDESYEYYDEDEEYSGSEYEEEGEYFEEEEEEIDYTQQPQQQISEGSSYDYNNITKINNNNKTNLNDDVVSESHHDIAKDLEKLNITTPPVSGSTADIDVATATTSLRFNHNHITDDAILNDNTIIRTEEYNYDSMNNTKKELGYNNEKTIYNDNSNFNATMDLLKDDLNYIESMDTVAENQAVLQQQDQQDEELVVVSSNESIQQQLDCNDIKSIPNDVIHDNRDIIKAVSNNKDNIMEYNDDKGKNNDILIDDSINEKIDNSLPSEDNHNASIKKELVINENDYSKIVSPAVEEEQSKEQNEESINDDTSSNKISSKIQFEEKSQQQHVISANMNIATPYAENDLDINNNEKKDEEDSEEEEEKDVDNNEITSFQQQILDQKLKLSKSQSKIKEEISTDNEEGYRQELILKEEREEKSQQQQHLQQEEQKHDNIQLEHQQYSQQQNQQEILLIQKLQDENKRLQIEQITQNQQVNSLQNTITANNNNFLQKQKHNETLLSQTMKNADTNEQNYISLQKQYKELTIISQRQQRALQEMDSSRKEVLQQCNDKDNDMNSLRNVISDMRKMVTTCNERAVDAENVLESVKQDKSIAEKEFMELNDLNDTNIVRIETLMKDVEEMEGLRMELQMLKEARDHDLQHIQTTVESASTTHNKIANERDSYKSQASDLQQQLTALQADLKLSQSDYERALQSHENLQKALEGMQLEHDGEIALLVEQRNHSEQVASASAGANLTAVQEANEVKMNNLQRANDMAIRNLMSEIDIMEKKHEQLHKDNGNLRRSLDEAISRLQLSQEDVIDRSLMKNILLDYILFKTKNRHSNKQKSDILQVLASVLHFTEDEKEQVGVASAGVLYNKSGRIGKFVDAVAAPLPPSVLNMDKLEGGNVREKWVNFLLAESGGGDDDVSTVERKRSTPTSTNTISDDFLKNKEQLLQEKYNRILSKSNKSSSSLEQKNSKNGMKHSTATTSVL